jgi:hypothetical protein
LIYDKSEYPSVSEQQIRDSIKGIEP